jgi:phosphoribosylformimino-5-aminoimidazole carboxamide ribotide isomerase
MIIIPAIDIKSERCVRLKEGKMDQETIFSEHPVEMARQWFSKGAEILHLVDLDGAIQGKPVNQKVILEIASEFKNKVIQVGGGIRNLESAAMGTSAIKEPEILRQLSSTYPKSIVLALDVYQGNLQTEGWVEASTTTPLDLLNSLSDIKISSIIYTDISKDGMMSGPNVEATVELARSTTIPVIASGGVSSLDHIRELSRSNVNLEGVICGRSLYENAFSLEEAIAESQQKK